MPTYSRTQVLNQNMNTAPQAVGTDATGADTYAAILTANALRRHIYIHNSGTHPAIISLDSGTTDHFFIPGSHAGTFDGVTIESGDEVQAKNGTPGSNYTGLYITIW